MVLERAIDALPAAVVWETYRESVNVVDSLGFSRIA